MDALRGSYFATVESYIQKNLMTKLDADPDGNVTMNVGSQIIDAEIVDVSPSEITDKEAVNIVNYADCNGISNAHGLRTARFKAMLANKRETKCLLNAAYANHETRGLVMGGIKAALGAAMAVTAGVFAAMLITKQKAAVKKMKATLNVTLGTKMRDIKDSYGVLNSVIEDNLFIYDSIMTPQRTQSTQVYA